MTMARMLGRRVQRAREKACWKRELRQRPQPTAGR
jgi:hypothetical protein